MASHRIERVNDQLRAEISDLIRQMKDPRLHGMISVIEVETSHDLRRARVFISIMATDEERTETFATLQRASGFFRHELSERLHMKRTPELDLRLDTSIERGARIISLLRNVQPADGAAGTAGALPEGAVDGQDDQRESDS